MHRTEMDIPVTEVTSWRCDTCGRRVGKEYVDDDGRRYRDCDCTRRLRESAINQRKEADEIPRQGE